MAVLDAVALAVELVAVIDADNDVGFVLSAGPVRKKLPAIGSPSPSELAKAWTSKPVIGEDALTNWGTAVANVEGSSNRRSVYLQGTPDQL